MFSLEKFYSPEFDPGAYWDKKYRLEEIGATSQAESERQLFWPLLKDLLQPGGSYLDAGCGLGGWMLFLRQQGFTVAGMDMAEQTVAALKEYDPTLDVRVGSVDALPYADNAFDGVLMIGTLEYLEGAVPRSIAESYRVLKPGGFVFIEVPIANVLRQVVYVPLKRLEKVWRQARGEQATFSNYLFDRRELKKLLTQAGFTVVAEQPHELPEATRHYGLWIDWPFLRAGTSEPYALNVLGRMIKKVANALSPWIISTGVIVVAKKGRASGDARRGTAYSS